MSKQFLKSGQVVLLNGGYLSSAESKNPVFHAGFVAAQERAHYVCTFAKLAEGKDFEGKKAFTLEELQDLVAKELATKTPEYVSAPKKVTKKLADELAEEAKKFMAYTDECTNVEKINAFLQEFNILRDFEEHGLFFEEDIVKFDFNKIYTVKEITKAVKSTIKLLS